MSAEKRSISAQRELFEQADARTQQLGYANFSQYVQALIRADVLSEGAHLREATNSAKVAQAADEILQAAVLAAHAGDVGTPPSSGPVKYPPLKRSNKKRPHVPPVKQGS